MEPLIHHIIKLLQVLNQNGMAERLAYHRYTKRLDHILLLQLVNLKGSSSQV